MSAKRVIYMLMQNKVIVICSYCGAMAPYEQAGADNPYGTFRRHEPCPRCGAENWAAAEMGRDWRTGRPNNPTEKE